VQAKPVIAFATFAVAFGLAAAPVLAEQTQAAPDAAAPAAAKQQDKSKRVCKTVVPSGTRLGQRVCRTATEWEEQARMQGDFLERGQREGSRRDGEFNTPH
jgi:hypothetical protein